MPQCAKMLSRSSGRPYGQACIGLVLGGVFRGWRWIPWPQRLSVPIGARCIGSLRPYGSRPDAAGRIHHGKLTCIVRHCAMHAD